MSTLTPHVHAVYTQYVKLQMRCTANKNGRWGSGETRVDAGAGLLSGRLRELTCGRYGRGLELFQEGRATKTY